MLKEKYMRIYAWNVRSIKGVEEEVVVVVEEEIIRNQIEILVKTERKMKGMKEIH